MAIEIVDLPIKVVIFHSYVTVYQRVHHDGALCNDELKGDNNWEELWQPHCVTGMMIGKG